MVYIRDQIKSFLVNNKNWFLLAAFFFILGIVTGALLEELGYNLFNLSLSEQQEALEKLAEKIFSGSPLQGAAILFLHNFITISWLMLTGVILGIPPLLGLYMNGSLLASVLFSLSEAGADSLIIVLLGILPHGIFELPALFMGTALGLKLGFHLIFPLPQKSRWESLKHIAAEMLRLLPLLIKMLAVAALIEIFITPRLLGIPLPF